MTPRDEVPRDAETVPAGIAVPLIAVFPDTEPVEPAQPAADEPLASGGAAAGQAGGGRRGLLRRAGWNLADQLLSAATNAALSFTVARAVGVTGFGAFAAGFTVFTLVIGVGRALVGQPLQIRYSTASERTTADAVARGMGTIIAVTIPVSLGCALTGLLIGGILRSTLLAFAVVLPGLVLQDNCRSVFFARARADLATLNDALWAVIQFGTVALLIVTDHASAWSLTLAWGWSALICSALGLSQLKAFPQVSAAGGWIHEHRDLVGYLVADFLLGAGALQGGILLIGAFIGLDDLGSIKAAQVLTGPLGVLVGAAMAFGLPEVSRRSTLSSARRWQLAIAVSTVMSLAGLVYAGILLLIPDGFGEVLFGDTWTGASDVLLPVSLVAVFAAGCLGPVIVILALGQSKATFRLTVIEAVMVLTVLLAGAELDGVVGAAWGLSIQQAILIPLWFLQLRTILGQIERGELSQPAPGAA